MKYHKPDTNYSYHLLVLLLLYITFESFGLLQFLHKKHVCTGEVTLPLLLPGAVQLSHHRRVHCR
jgi:hypothetical protein